MRHESSHKKNKKHSKKHTEHKTASPVLHTAEHHTSHTHAHKGRTHTEEDAVEPRNVEHELRTIYALDPEEKDLMDMSKLDIVKQPFVRRILIATLLLLIAIGAGITGALLLNNPFGAGQTQVLTFDITTSKEPIVSGRETVITIPYANPSSVPIAELEVTVHVPDSFVLAQATPEPIKTAPLTWAIGSVAPHAQGTIELHGTFYETPGTAITIQTITRYAPANFSSPFEDIESESILIEESIFQTSITGPDRAVPGESVTYTVVVEQSEETPQTNVELRLALPNGFHTNESSAKPDIEGISIWTISELINTEPYTLTLKGTFASDAEGDQPLTATAGVHLHDQFIAQREATFTSHVLASDFALSLIANGQTGNSILLPGDDLTLNVSLDNRGEEIAEALTIELFIDAGTDRVRLEDRSGIPNGDVYGNKINWDKRDMNRLETLRGGESASIDVAIPTRETGATTIKLHAEARVTTVGDIEINRTIVSSPITIRIASDLSGSSSAQYYNAQGVPIGYGPLPPQVGEETSYRVTWTVVNALNDVEDAVMVAAIPSDSVWGGLVSVTQGTVTYDSVGNRVRWAIGNLPTGTPPPVAIFDMHVKPTSADLNTFLDLLGVSSITAVDVTTGSTVSATAPALTSEIANDAHAENKGIVVE
ncbi:hypothetical protein COV06_03625 [Candidatus Uhrbacteria bacterium CG10_big_fil_rev_8_21_14_0_10_50_16]|uniref:DUF11 domain-containing protein n=1 Tax=Candidatus Uhrbacteria bacterium CG10_big_fil_rev_8_21_14_0_10_50_16 TaxID=1975039 RepID=A0A2H0RNF0_9BACT|nr:MAG: hypothetical protein COV06_03625 [Candidatus Uhrbacteria bacterium CG10_big_fil_rev_8_21_14_0_10_50_16]